MVFHTVARALWHGVAMMKLRKANERGHAEHGWLDTYHTFSFADYYDPQWMGFRSLRVINDDLVMPGDGLRHPSASRHGNHHLHPERRAGAQGFDGQRPRHPRRRGAIHGRRHGRAAQRIQSVQRRGGASAANLDSAGRTGVKPRYAEKSLAKAPTGKLHLVTSKTGRDGSIAIHQDADLWLGKFQPGDRATHKLAKGRNAWIHVAEGEVSLNGKTLVGGDAAAVSDEGALELSAAKPSQVLLFDLN